MNSRTICYVILVVLALLGYNAFLAQRDQKMFDAYFGETFEQSIKK